MDARATDVRRAAVAVAPVVRNQAVGQGGVLGEEVDDVHPEAVDPALQPPEHHRVHGLPDLGVLPVQVGLLAGEQVQVVLPARLVVGPGRAGEERAPVVGLRSGCTGLLAGPGRTPDVPVAHGARGAAVARGREPGVLVGRVVDDQIHDQLHAALVDRGEQPVEVVQRTEERVDVLVVADVVAVVGVRGGIDRGQPQHVDIQLGQVVQMLDDARQITDAVGVRVGEAARIDLVYHRVLPPCGSSTGVVLGHVETSACGACELVFRSTADMCRSAGCYEMAARTASRMTRQAAPRAQRSC